MRERWKDQLDYLLVDEYLDTNTIQYQLVKRLAGDKACFTVVGDDDQSIYSWQGANPQNLHLLNEDFPQLRVIKLEQNYRSSGRILNAANILIANNSHLYLGNHQARIFEKILLQNRIPHKISGGDSFFSRPEIKDSLAYLRLLTNPDDDSAFLRIINTPKREIGAVTIQKLGK